MEKHANTKYNDNNNDKVCNGNKNMVIWCPTAHKHAIYV